MTKNLETADTVVKLVLAFAIIIFYFIGLITGPFAVVLLVLSIVVWLIFLAKIAYALMIRD